MLTLIVNWLTHTKRSTASKGHFTLSLSSVFDNSLYGGVEGTTRWSVSILRPESWVLNLSTYFVLYDIKFCRREFVCGTGPSQHCCCCFVAFVAVCDIATGSVFYFSVTSNKIILVNTNLAYILKQRLYFNKRHATWFLSTLPHTNALTYHLVM